ncbi:MAG: NADH:ubiquinone reductase (Na(+)-transporting) subunit B [Bacteroidetes bacterium HGW-Bacteroidetes-5]|jgi:Na+-transporting NADH:ubiquinone oxidoreductase subunit B|nr:MAG: NADH:ubiquinone reductase (Na(+)-transporting) subunit B [Bacteroidetes bacterium HGW-Bacteroidetes-5]
MKAIRKLVDNIKPTFSKGGKLSFLHSTFDAFETFLFVPNTVTKKGSHIRDSIELKRTMTMVIIALLPALLFGMWNVGYQHSLATGANMDFWQIVLYGFIKVIPMVIVSYVVGLGIEFISAQIRGHEVNEGYLVTGMLVPLIMPVDLPLWMLALSVVFAVIVGKEVFGGTGMNIWNPALIARAFAFFAYPSHMSGDKVWVAGLTKGEGIVDGFSGATPLANAQAGLDLPSFQDMFLGIIPGSVGETSTLAILLGAALLLFTGIASWRIMLSVFAGGLLTGLFLNLVAPSPESYLAVPAWNHLVMGGFAFGAVFMATDPVTGSQTEKGKWFYGFLIGFFAVIIRVFNPGYPEGMMLAILLLNTFAPLIDHIVVQASIKKRLRRAVIK